MVLPLVPLSLPDAWQRLLQKILYASLCRKWERFHFIPNWIGTMDASSQSNFRCVCVHFLFPEVATVRTKHAQQFPRTMGSCFKRNSKTPSIHTSCCPSRSLISRNGWEISGTLWVHRPWHLSWCLWLGFALPCRTIFVAFKLDTFWVFDLIVGMLHVLLYGQRGHWSLMDLCVNGFPHLGTVTASRSPATYHRSIWQSSWTPLAVVWGWSFWIFPLSGLAFALRELMVASILTRLFNAVPSIILYSIF